MGRWLVVALLVVGALLAAGGPFVDLALTEERTDRIAVDGEVGAVDVTTRNGRIEVTVGDTVTVETRARWALREPDPSIEVDGGVLRVEDGCPVSGWPFGSCQVSVHVTAPATVAARLTATNGAIDFPGRAAEVAALSTNGDITGGGLGASAVAAATTNGNVELAFDVVPGVVDARTVNGGIEVIVPQATYDVDADTTNGRVSVEVPHDPSAPQRIDAHTVNGPVVVTTP